jgi:penicillin-binding protein 1B
VYLTAYEKSKELNPLTLVSDQKKTYKYSKQSWTPENYTKKYLDEVSHQYALKQSLNSATAAVGMELPLSEIIDIFRRAGVNSTIPEVPSLVLGAMDLKPIEVVEAYSTLARLGSHQSLRFWQALVSTDGTAQVAPLNLGEQKFSSEASAMVVGMLKATNQNGTAQLIGKSNPNFQSAGKTGTTSDYRDAWYAGFTPRYLTLVWIGYDRSQNHGLTGASGPLPVWLPIMQSLSRHQPNVDFAWPETVLSEMQNAPPEVEPSQVILRK